MRMATFGLLLFILHSISSHSLGAADHASDWAKMLAITPRGYVCGRVQTPLVMDGKLDEADWQAAPLTEPFVDIEGLTRIQPRLRTQAKMLWDDNYLYIAAQLEEPHVWATLKEHDAVIFQDNDFEVFIDPDGDNHQYFEFEINALNTGWDLYLPKPYKDGGSADNGWEIAGLKSAVSIDGTLNVSSDIDQGWSVELAIPWTAFQPPKLAEIAKQKNESLRPRGGDKWRIDFSRVEWQHEIVDGQYRKVPNTKEDNWVWSPQGIIDMHRPERWGYVQFVDQAVTSSAFKQVQFQADASLAVRDRLMTVYHHQRAFREQNQRWAKDLTELGLSIEGVTLMPSTEGFVASATLKAGDGKLQRWYVREDSRLWTSDYQPEVALALANAGENATELQRALDSVTSRQREGLEFLIAHMPKRDLVSLKAEFLIENVRDAYETLDAAPWHNALPKEVFFNNVLPYASINERRDNWRKDFRERFGHLVREAKTPGHAAALLNQRLYPMVKVKYSTLRKKADQSPYESINSGLASCTGLSVLLIDACRAVGVPARFVGTPLWTDGSGNHSWLEVWDNGWHFTGAAEPNGDELDKAWFIDRASKARRDEPMHAIYAVSYAKTPLKFPMVWAADADYIHAVNVTDRYTQLATKPPAGTTRVYFRVFDPNGKRVSAKLTVSSNSGGQTWSGDTNDERFDSNDHLGFNLPSGSKLTVKADLGGRAVSTDFEVKENLTVTLNVD